MEDIKVSTFEELQREMCICCLIPDRNSSFRCLSPDIWEIFNMCTKLRILLHDNIPDRICQTCHQHLVWSNNFIIQCKKSYDIITSYVSSRIKSEVRVISEVSEFKGDGSECVIKTEWLVDTDESEIPNFYSPNQKENDNPIKTEIPTSQLFQFDFSEETDRLAPHGSDIASESNLEESKLAKTVKVKEPTKKRKKKTHSDKRSKTKDSIHLAQINKSSNTNLETIHVGNAKSQDYSSDSTDTADGEIVTNKNGEESQGHNSDSTDTADEEIVNDIDAEQPKFSCSKCNEQFYYMRDLSHHMNVHTEILDRTCDICGKVFTKKGGLTVHKKIHNDDKPFACDVCGLRFIYRSSLKDHKTTHTGEKRYACEKCGKKFRTLKCLKIHGSTHSTGTPFECKMCGKRYKNRNILNMHQRRCGKRKMHCCDMCGKLLSTHGELRVHVRSHTKEKPFPCPHCDKRYRTHSHRAVHVRTHTGERPHKCNICGKAFLLRRTLLVHTRIHTGELPYKCSVCGRCFRQAPALKTHMKVHRKGEGHKRNNITDPHQESPKYRSHSQAEKEDIK